MIRLEQNTALSPPLFVALNSLNSEDNSVSFELESNCVANIEALFRRNMAWSVEFLSKYLIDSGASMKLFHVKCIVR